MKKKGAYLGDNLELLALAVLGLGNGLLKTGDGLAVEFLQSHAYQYRSTKHTTQTHLSTGNVKLNLTTVSAHESTELLANTLQSTQTVVLGKGSEKVLQDIALIGTSNLLELDNDLLLVGVGQGRGTEDGGQLLVGLQGLTEGSDSLGGGVESGGLGRSSVLEREGLEMRFSQIVARGLFNSGIDAEGVCRRGRGRRSRARANIAPSRISQRN